MRHDTAESKSGPLIGRGRRAWSDPIGLELAAASGTAVIWDPLYADRAPSELS